jgi:hypothetical protein
MWGPAGRSPSRCRFWSPRGLLIGAGGRPGDYFAPCIAGYRCWNRSGITKSSVGLPSGSGISSSDSIKGMSRACWAWVDCSWSAAVAPESAPLHRVHKPAPRSRDRGVVVCVPGDVIGFNASRPSPPLPPAASVPQACGPGRAARSSAAAAQTTRRTSTDARPAPRRRRR